MPGDNNINFKFELWSRMREDCVKAIEDCIKEGRVYDFDDIVFETESYQKDLENGIVSIIVSKLGRVPESIPMYNCGNVTSLLEDTAYLYECVYGSINTEKLAKYSNKEPGDDSLYSLIAYGKNIWKIRQAIKDGTFYKESEISQVNTSIFYKDIENLRWGIDGPKYQYKTESDIAKRFGTFGG